jgi:hypothetical protein
VRRAQPEKKKRLALIVSLALAVHVACREIKGMGAMHERNEEAVHCGSEKLGRVNRGTLGKFASLVVFLIDALNFLRLIPWDGGSMYYQSSNNLE